MRQLQGVILLAGLLVTFISYAQQPVACWNFDSLDARDSGPYSFDGTLKNITFNEGVNCTKAAWFNGDSSYIDCGNILDTLFTKNIYSISAWVYPQAYSDSKGLYSVILNNWNVSTDSTNAFIFGLDKFFTNSNRVYFSPVQLNVWTHIAIVISNKTANIYKNGILLAHDTNYISNKCPKNLLIGALSYDHYFYKGGIDDLRIYDFALNQEEVSTIMKENMFSGQYLYNIDTMVDSTVTFGPEMIPGYSYMWNTSGVESPLLISSGYSTSKKFILEIKASDECIVTDSAIITWHKKGDNQVTRWNFNDSADMVNQGILINNAVVGTGVACSKSFIFNGSDSHINLGDTLNSLFTGNEFTISLWAYLDDTIDIDNKFPVLLSKWDSSGKTENSFYLSIERFQFADDATMKAIYFNTPIINKWHHYVIVRHVPETRVYIDNNYVGSCFNGPINHSTMPLLIGALKNNNSNLKGKIDELKFFDRAISEFEISGLYNEVEIQKLNALEDFSVGYLESAILDAGGGFDSYFWSDGKTTQTNILENITSSINNITVFAIKDEVCFSDTASIKLTNSVRKTMKGDGYKIWPCPATYELQVSFDTEIPSRIEILSMQGQVLKTINACSDFSSIDISELTTGYYLVHIYFNESTITEKIIITD